MGKYLVMIYDNEAMWAEAGTPAEEANHLRHQAFTQRTGLRCVEVRPIVNG